MNSIDNSTTLTTLTTITLSAFEKLLLSKDWTHCSEIDELYTYESQLEDDDGRLRPIKSVCGDGRVVSRLGNITITYTEGYGFIAGDKESFQSSFKGQNAPPWDVDWLIVVDEDDEIINPERVKFPREFSWVDYEIIKASI